jgi:lipocalin
LWILARDKELEKETLESLVGLAKNLGFLTDELIFVDHSEVSDAAS